MQKNPKGIGKKKFQKKRSLLSVLYERYYPPIYLPDLT